ncbi:unnamed protein product [Polarella glacialis]|uniref:Dol-P-Glc:Glc(2)Man(9)GlcNAc(2)-PP-Dol alpha-1,2-glucosyltransferase n=2 Tax=Polarella glacialis TaxID=89957 RepID=A0A813LFN5_POLGL|nr:unnamed protein product [Polarella glacialis]
MDTPWWLLALICHCVLLAPWVLVFQGADVEPYMDEVFHIPQAQRYCEGRFEEWDEKITTFPGLYVFSAALSRVSRPFGGQLCSPARLRADNALLSLGVQVLLYRLLRRRLPPAKAAAQALALSLYPIHFFCAFIYYTDVGSLFWALLVHDLATPSRGRALPTSGRIVLAAVAGLVAILFRQTNAVWMMFSFGTAALGDLQSTHKWGPQLRGEELTPSLLFTFAKALLLESRRLVFRLGPLLIPVLLFVAFVVHNGSIVVGDKSNHEASVHWAQLAYLSAVTAAMWGLVGPDAAVSAGSLRAFCKARFGSLRAVLLTAVALCLLVFVLHRYSVAHPFLLADNRHYTFYVWGRFLGRRPGLKEALAPAYLYTAWLCSSRLSRAQSSLWTLIWWVAAALTLVPAGLLEPRYWTTAVLMAHAHAEERSWRSICVSGLLSLAINTATLAVFVYRPFIWPGGELARFMW